VLGLPRVRSTAEDAEIGIECTSREAPNSGSSASSAVDLAFLPGRHGWRTWGARNAISRSYPMQRGAGRRRRVGRVQTGTAGRRTWRTTDWGVRSGPGQGARVANPRQDTMIRETVRFGGADGGVRSGHGQGARVANPRQDTMIRETVRFGGADGGVRSGHGQEARVANPRQDTMIRETVRLGGADGGVRSGPGQGARVANPRQDAMIRETVRFGSVDAECGPAPGKRHGSRITGRTP